ncbi:MAG: hypothetical protein ACREJS_12500, partial [Candidatus Rokuibacteriota bacterium]
MLVEARAQRLEKRGLRRLGVFGLGRAHHAPEAAPAGQLVLERDDRLVRALGAFAVARPGEMDGQGRLPQRGFRLALDVAHVLGERRLGQHPVALGQELIEHPLA